MGRRPLDRVVVVDEMLQEKFMTSGSGKVANKSAII